MRVLGTVLCVATVLGGCASAGASPSPSSSTPPAASTPPTATPAAASSSPPPGPSVPEVTPEPLIGDLATTASVERDGVRLTVTLDRNPLVAGQPTWVTTEVRNTGRDDLIWFHDGCAIAVGVWGTVEGATWRLGGGHSAKGADFKLWALDNSGASGPVTIYFTPEKYIGYGRIGCPDIGLSDVVPPGGTIRAQALWDGQANRALGPAPSGPVELVGGFRYYWRETSGEPADITRQIIEVRLASWVVGGRDRTLLDPGEVVDAALADADFAAWIEGQEMRSGADAVLRMAPDQDVWWVGLVQYFDDKTSRLHAVLVHPRTGAVLGTVDRDWSFETEGNP